MVSSRSKWSATRLYHTHEPGRVFAVLSGPWVLPVATASWRAANAAVGRVGNKLAVVGVRQPLGAEPGTPGLP